MYTTKFTQYGHGNSPPPPYNKMESHNPVKTEEYRLLNMTPKFRADPITLSAHKHISQTNKQGTSK